MRPGIDEAMGDPERCQSFPNAMHVGPAWAVGIRPEHHLSPGQHAQHLVARRACRTGHGGDGEDLSGGERVAGLLALDEDNRRAWRGRGELVGPVERKVVELDSTEASLPVPLPDAVLRAPVPTGFKPDVLGDVLPVQCTEGPAPGFALRPGRVASPSVFANGPRAIRSTAEDPDPQREVPRPTA